MLSPCPALIVPLKPAAYKIMFVLPLCHYFLQEPKQTCSLTETHQPQHQKKKDTEKKNHSAQETQEHKRSVLKKRDNSYPLHLFSPLQPHAHLASHTVDKPRGFLQLGSWPEWSRTLDVPGSQFFLALLHQSLMFQWGWVVGRRAQGWPHQACVCPGVGSIEVRPLVQGLIFPHNGSTGLDLRNGDMLLAKNTSHRERLFTGRELTPNSDQNPASLVPSSPQRG